MANSLDLEYPSILISDSVAQYSDMAKATRATLFTAILDLESGSWLIQVKANSTKDVHAIILEDLFGTASIEATAEEAEAILGAKVKPAKPLQGLWHIVSTKKNFANALGYIVETKPVKTTKSVVAKRRSRK